MVTEALRNVLAVGAVVSLGGCLLCLMAGVVRRIMTGRWTEADDDDEHNAGK